MAVASDTTAGCHRELKFQFQTFRRWSVGTGYRGDLCWVFDCPKPLMNRFPPVWCLLSSESELDQPALAGFFLSMSTLSATNLRQCRRVDWQVWTVALKLGYIMDEAVWGPTGSFQGPWNQNSNPWTKLPQNPLLQTYWGQKCHEEIWGMWNAHPRSELEALATSTEMLALWPVSVEKKLTFVKSGVRYLQKSHLLWF